MNKKNILSGFYDQVFSYFKFDHKISKDEAFIRNITFQVTEDCPLACTYCYESHKSSKMMSKDTGKKLVDLLFKMWDDDNDPFINKQTKGLILEFIGGEQFLNVEVMDFICDYFFDTCFKRNHPWLIYTRISMASNGVLYFEDNVQHFINKYKDFLSMAISIDGPQEIHDACRIFKNGQGSFAKANAAEKHWMQLNPDAAQSSKVTIAPENLNNINKILQYFINENKAIVYANVINEANWNIEQAKIFYNELKKMADFLLNNTFNVIVSLFDENFFHPLPEHDLQCWCGGAGKMLAFDPDGNAYPCLRYMPTSLGDNIPPVIIGDVNGIFKTDEHQQIRDTLNSINRRAKNDDECFYCPIAAGCADCEAWNYQSAGGVFNIKSKNICWMHRARALANYYYWNNLYIKTEQNKRMPICIEEEKALQIISSEEFNFLKKLAIL